MATPIFQQGRRAVVLLSDADADFHELARDALAAGPMRVDVHYASSSEACLAFLQGGSRHAEAARPDLLLLDMNMAGADAADVLRNVRADPALRALPTIVCSTAATDEDVRRMYELGCNGFILKPATLAGLRRTMGRLARYWFDTSVLPER